MITESKNIDFYTSGRQPTEDDFKRISEWIQRKKQKKVGSRKLINQQKLKKRIALETKN